MTSIVKKRDTITLKMTGLWDPSIAMTTTKVKSKGNDSVI